MSPVSLPPGQRLVVVFLSTIFAPGLLLAILGARALWQERRAADQQLRDVLGAGAEAAARSLGEQLARWKTPLGQQIPPEKAFHDLPPDGTWVYVERSGGAPRTYPRNALPYELNAPDPASPPDRELARLQRLELTESEPARLVAMYEQLAARARGPLMPEVKHRLARVLRNAGRTDEALRLWREVQAAGGRIGSLPAELVAGLEIAAAQPETAAGLYDRLVEGRWRLEKARYLYYSSVLRGERVESQAETRKLRLAEAAEAAVNSDARVFGSEDALHVILRRDSPLAALVLTPDFLAARVWPRVFAADGELRVSRIAVNGRTVHGPVSTGDAAVFAGRTLEEGGLSWRVEVEPKALAAFYAGLRRRSNLYAAMLALVTALLGFGGYVVARTVRREMDVARLKSEFVSTVSHEFRSPLTGIRQLAEALARGRVSAESKRQQYYELIVQESERLARLVENVLDFSRMEEGRKQYRFEPVETAAWLSQVAEEFRQDASRSGYRLEVSIPGWLPAIAGDREALSTEVRNLLDNAVKYSPERKTVWLDAEAVNGGVSIRVRDQGVGIAAGEREHIFEKFYRGGGEQAKKVKGAGLGLCLVKHIVESHRGEVVVESREGEGSTFSIHLAGAP